MRDPDFDKVVARMEVYRGPARSFAGTIKIVFEDGSAMLSGQLLKRYFETESELDKWS